MNMLLFSYIFIGKIAVVEWLIVCVCVWQLKVQTAVHCPTGPLLLYFLVSLVVSLSLTLSPLVSVEEPLR